MSTIFKNRLQELIRQRYKTDSFKPTPELLQSLGMTSRRFATIYRKSQNPSFEELYLLCETFEFEPGQMYSKVEKPKIELNNFKNKIVNKHVH